MVKKQKVNRGRKFNKNNKHGQDKFFKKGVRKEKDKEVPKYIKNFKYSQRNKESEDALKRLAFLENKHKVKNEFFKNRELKSYLENEDYDDSMENGNFYNKLIDSLKSNSKKSKAIDSSDDEDDEDDESGENIDRSEVHMSDNDQISDSDPEEEKMGTEPPLEETEESEVGQEDSDDETGDIVEEDCYFKHFGLNINPKLLTSLQDPLNSGKVHKTSLNWPILGNLLFEAHRLAKHSKETQPETLLSTAEKFAPEGDVPNKIDLRHISLNNLNISKKLQKNMFYGNRVNKENFSEKDMTAFQWDLFSILNNYQDFYFPYRTFKTGEEIRFAYVLHSMNHILKSRTEVIKHNALLTKQEKDIDDVIRDQGLVRNKVLMVLPLKDAAYRVINMLIDSYVPELGGKVINHKRFMDEFTGDELELPKINRKPEDYEQIFRGNTDDNFRIGISLTKKCLKLYSDFYSSDIIVASPLGLRMIIGAVGDEKRDFDFLASIEVLIIDQLDVMYAQNWDHLLHIFDHLHLQPKSRENTDFSRVRNWSLNGLSRFYRQTVIFSNQDMPEFRSVFNNRCQNYRGKIRASHPISMGSIRHCTVQVPQTFHRINTTSVEGSFDDRFEYFTNVILPQFTVATKAHCLVYIPSYFDFVRIRNYFKKEINQSCVQICEYTKDAKTARARDMFYHSGSHFLLYTERSHFFRRPKIKGIRHLIFYQPPSVPHFYPEMVNFMQEAYQNPRDGLEHNMTITVLYTKYDSLQLAAILSSKNSADLMKLDKKTHLFVIEQ